MSKSPIINAGAAVLYIGMVVLFIHGLSNPNTPDPDTLLIPLSMISLLVLSVLFMSYCFFFQPLQMYLDGKKTEAVNLFTKSVAIFAGLVVLFWGLLLFFFI